MKKILLSLTLLLSSVILFAQPGVERSKASVKAIDNNLKIITSVELPHDTIPNAPVGSVASIGDTVYVKISTKWEKFVLQYLISSITNQDLQDITDNGNTTSDNIVINDGSSGQVVLLKNVSGEGQVDVNSGALFASTYVKPGIVELFYDSAYLKYRTNGLYSTYLKFVYPTHNNNLYLPNKGGTLATLDDITTSSGGVNPDWAVRDSLDERPSYDLVDGDKFLVSPSPTTGQEFDGHENEIATYEEDTDDFTFDAATSGDLLFNAATGSTNLWTGTVWLFQSKPKLTNGGESASLNGFASVGTNANYGLEFKTNGTRKAFISSGGQWTFNTAPNTNSDEDFDVLVRSNISKRLEKVPVSSFMHRFGLDDVSAGFDNREFDANGRDFSIGNIRQGDFYRLHGSEQLGLRVDNFDRLFLGEYSSSDNFLLIEPASSRMRVATQFFYPNAQGVTYMGGAGKNGFAGFGLQSSLWTTGSAYTIDLVPYETDPAGNYTLYVPSDGPTVDTLATRDWVRTNGSGGGYNFANTDLTFTADRTHNADGYNLTVNNLASNYEYYIDPSDASYTSYFENDAYQLGGALHVSGDKKSEILWNATSVDLYHKSSFSTSIRVELKDAIITEGDIQPRSSNVFNIGSSDSIFNHGYFDTLHANFVDAPGIGGSSYTDEEAQDAVGAMVDATLVYNDGTPVLKRAAITGDVTIADGSNTAAIASGVIVDADINSSAAIDASKIGGGGVSTTEYNYLGSVTSDIQTQINGKQASGSYVVTTNNLSDLGNVGTARTNLGGTTAGSNLFTVANPSAISFPKFNADNTVSTRTPTQVKTDLSLDNVPNVDATNASNISSGTLADARYQYVKTALGGSYAATNTVTASSTQYLTAFGSYANFNNENVRSWTVPSLLNGTVRSLTITTGTAQPASGSLTITVRKNSTGQTLTLTIAANGTAGTYTDNTHSFSVSAGDILSIEAVNAATGASAAVVSVSAVITNY